MKTTKLIYSSLILVMFFVFSSNSLFAQVTEEEEVEEVSEPIENRSKVKSEPVPGAEVYVEQEGKNPKTEKKSKEEKEKKEKKEAKKEEEAEIEE